MPNCDVENFIFECNSEILVVNNYKNWDQEYSRKFCAWNENPKFLNFKKIILKCKWMAANQNVHTTTEKRGWISWKLRGFSSNICAIDYSLFLNNKYALRYKPVFTGETPAVHKNHISIQYNKYCINDKNLYRSDNKCLNQNFSIE